MLSRIDSDPLQQINQSGPVVSPCGRARQRHELGQAACRHVGSHHQHTHGAQGQPHGQQVGRRVFVGSNTMLVAPVTLGDDSMTASGSVITRDVPATDLAIARALQVNKPGLAVRLFDKLRARKAGTTKGA